MVTSWCIWSWPCNEDEKHCCLWWQILVSWGSGWTGRRGPTWLHFGPWVLLGITESMMLTSWSLVNSLRHFLWTSSCSSKLALGFGVYSHCCAFNAFTICDTLHPRVTFVQVSHCFAGKHPPPCRAAAAASLCEPQRDRSRHVSTCGWSHVAPKTGSFRCHY